MKPLILLASLVILALAQSVPARAQTRESDRSRPQNYGSNRGGVLRDVPLPDLNAYTADGKKLSLRALCDRKFTVLVAGCLTCPQFHRGYPEIEAAKRDYSPKGVQFFYFYKSLRHPELDGYVEAQNISERLLQLAAARKKLGTSVTWIADTIDNEIRDGLRSGSNSVFLVSPEGNIAYAADKLDGPGLRDALAEFVGKVQRPTHPDDLDLPVIAKAQRPANANTATQVARTEGLVIVNTIPKTPEKTYYVKLRAEADAALLKTGTGRLFLGFYPDPIHGVHWNNLTRPMKYSLTLPSGMKADPVEASAQKGPGDKDVNPRQFWVKVGSDTPGMSFTLSMHYFGCTDTMCRPLTHEYTVQLKPADMGSSTFGFNRGGGQRRGRQGRRPKLQTNN